MTRQKTRRRTFVVAIVLLGLQLVVGGCTFLIAFDDQPIGEGLTTADGSVPKRDSQAGDDDVLQPVVDEDAEPKPDVMTSTDAGFDVYELDSCAGQLSGQYCGNNLRDGATYPYKDDLVVCDAGKIANVRTCNEGVGCVHLKDPRPDECDDCGGRKNGFYCGRQLTGWKPENAGWQVQCMNGSQIAIRYCSPTACVNGATTACNQPPP